MGDILQFDDWLRDEGPSAIVMREPLMPAEGEDGVVFPATFAAGDGFAGGYNVDSFMDGKNVCLIDSVGSQANRIEPLFMHGKYAGLVPQIVVKAGEKKVNLLEAGHRAGDAIVRCSSLRQNLQNAFKAVQNSDAEPLARIAPTSLIFGVWDSRDTQAKLPRLIASTIRAYDVRPLTRSAVYVPPVDYVGLGLVEEPADLRDAEGKIKGKHPFARRGFVHNPASASHGGVIATGGIRRDASLHLAALRLLRCNDADKTRKLHRYVFGLSLTAFTHPTTAYLRQGCTLVLDPKKPREFCEVRSDGRRNEVTVTHEQAFDFAKLAARDFGIDPDRNIDFRVLPDREVEFETERAREDLADDSEGGTRRNRPARARR